MTSGLDRGKALLIGIPEFIQAHGSVFNICRIDRFAHIMRLHLRYDDDMHAAAVLYGGEETHGEYRLDHQHLN